MKKNKDKFDFESLLVEGLKRAMKKMLDYKIRNDEDIVIANSKGGVKILKAKDYAKTLK